MAKKKQTVNVPSLIITVAAVLLAAAAVVFLIITMSKSKEQDQPAVTTPAETVYQPSNELLQSAEVAAPSLLTNNYKVYQYFTKGMSYKEEPYGAEPDDGFYTCVSSDYKTFEEFSGFVRSIYTDEAASQLLTDPFGNGPIYADDNGELGIAAAFVDNLQPIEDEVSWENGTYTFSLTSDTECEVDIVLKDKDGKDVKKQTKMILENDVWKLAEMIG